MSNNRYNPIASAFSAACSELSSDKAKAFYVQRSFEDAFALVGVVSALALAAYALGVRVRSLVNDLEGSKTKSEPMATIPCIAGLLMPCFDAAGQPAKDDTATPVVPIVPVSQASVNETFILSAIAPSIAALSLINSIEKTEKTLEVAKAEPKPKRKRKSKTETKPAPKGEPGIAPRKSPTRATFGAYSASID
jgi:hypothetical protein